MPETKDSTFNFSPASACAEMERLRTIGFYFTISQVDVTEFLNAMGANSIQAFGSARPIVPAGDGCLDGYYTAKEPVVIKLKSVVAGLSLVGLVAATGCTSTTAGRSSATAYQRDNDVMDIHPLESTTPAYQAAAYQPVQQPVTYDAPAPVTATAAMPVASAVAISSTPTASAGIGTHVVRKGETMYSIARESYGNGKQWKKIAMANPGVSPNSLKVGQSLIIP